MFKSRDYQNAETLPNHTMHFIRYSWHPGHTLTCGNTPCVTPSCDVTVSILVWNFQPLSHGLASLQCIRRRQILGTRIWTFLVVEKWVIFLCKHSLLFGYSTTPRYSCSFLIHINRIYCCLPFKNTFLGDVTTSSPGSFRFQRLKDPEDEVGDVIL